MKIGVVTWTLGLTAPAQAIAKARELGLDAIQYAGDFRDCSGSQLRQEAAAAGMRILAIDPFNAGPVQPDQASEQGAIAYYRKVIDFAVEAGHVPVTLQGLSQWTRNCPDKASAQSRLLACCKAVDAYAQEKGVRTLYEVCNHYEVPLIHTSDACRELISQVGGDNMRMILDSFHMNVNEPDPLATIRRNAAFTAIYHISDSGRGGIGSGHIDFRAQFDALLASGFTGDVAIEPVLPHRTPSLPPATGADAQLLDQEIMRSAAAWRSYLGGPVAA
ncbi:sugar phosphate isomerase/epimerase [Pantoea sp. Ap-967]|uniref:sugar phosphate isomerase/epimerase family protein n=1 Tax=Pantoea sp. Ap-967 TaxID=2608362 RepID=UPI001422C233|nr:sugar phosphate isomerase/epimerase family protein [Pantoea sp. Ap-967]NIE73283.1 sugar phosphate isomerase/epimerase [Pantoea sp. Ap-967]